MNSFRCGSWDWNDKQKFTIIPFWMFVQETFLLSHFANCLLASIGFQIAYNEMVLSFRDLHVTSKERIWEVNRSRRSFLDVHTCRGPNRHLPGPATSCNQKRDHTILGVISNKVMVSKKLRIADHTHISKRFYMGLLSWNLARGSSLLRNQQMVFTQLKIHWEIVFKAK